MFLFNMSMSATNNGQKHFSDRNMMPNTFIGEAIFTPSPLEVDGLHDPPRSGMLDLETPDLDNFDLSLADTEADADNIDTDSDPELENDEIG